MHSLLENSRMFPSTSSLLSLYASFSTFLMLIRNVYRELVPKSLESFILSKLSALFSHRNRSASYATFIIDDAWDNLERNTLIDASRFYLSSKVGRNSKVMRVGKFQTQNNVVAALVQGEKIVDVFEGIEITWKFEKGEKKDVDDPILGRKRATETGHFVLVFEEQYKEKVFNDYLNHILDLYKKSLNVKRTLKLFTRAQGAWSCTQFKHPATFDALAMDREMKKSIIDDLNRFLGRKDYYKKIGKAWKRGYLLYGPPGTGKSSLIASMANYLKFDVYDLELGNIMSDYDLRKAMLSINRKSITVIEDIDCNSGVRKRSTASCSDSSNDEATFTKPYSLSGLLNSIDGLWSSCGEERIIVFSTNRKEVLDPALLRAGRMDMHIHMSYCTAEGFRVLALNYVGVEEHPLFEEIDELIGRVEVTPAALAEELLQSDEADVALAHVIGFLRTAREGRERVEDEKHK